MACEKKQSLLTRLKKRIFMEDRAFELDLWYRKIWVGIGGRRRKKESRKKIEEKKKKEQANSRKDKWAWSKVCM